MYLSAIILSLKILKELISLFKRNMLVSIEENWERENNQEKKRRLCLLFYLVCQKDLLSFDWMIVLISLMYKEMSNGSFMNYISI